MYYREAGRLTSSYKSLISLMPGRENAAILLVLIVVAVGVVPFAVNEHILGTLVIPFLILSIASIGLNLLMGYAGQASLGSGGFMAVGAFVSYKLATNIPQIPMIFDLFIAGGVAAIVGVIFGLPSLRLRVFYLAIATLLAQFFLEWLFSKVPWFWNNNPSGVVSTPEFNFFGILVDTPFKTYYVVLGIVAFMTVIALNLLRTHIGRSWMSIRDNEVAALLMGINPVKAKLMAFAISSFYCGVAGAMWVFFFVKTVEVTSFSVEMSFKIMFMIIIGGLASITGSFLGAAFVLLLPIVISVTPEALGFPVSTFTAAVAELIIFGVLICFFVIKEPKGLARLLIVFSEKMRAWPFSVYR